MLNENCTESAYEYFLHTATNMNISLWYIVFQQLLQPSAIARELSETYLMHGRQIVEYALQFILLDAIADHDQLLEEQQNIGAYG